VAHQPINNGAVGIHVATLKRTGLGVERLAVESPVYEFRFCSFKTK
jgi:hypothetical protein